MNFTHPIYIYISLRTYFVLNFLKRKTYSVTYHIPMQCSNPCQWSHIPFPAACGWNMYEPVYLSELYRCQFFQNDGWKV